MADDKALELRSRLIAGDVVIVPLKSHPSADGMAIEFEGATIDAGDEVLLQYTVGEQGISDVKALRVIPLGYPEERGRRAALPSARARRGDAGRSGPR